MFTRLLSRNVSFLQISRTKYSKSSYSCKSSLVCKIPNPMLKIPKKTLQLKNHVCQTSRRFSLLLTVIGGMTARRWWLEQTPDMKRRFADAVWAYRQAICKMVAIGLGMIGTFLLYSMELDPQRQLWRLFIFNDQMIEKKADKEVGFFLDVMGQCCLLSVDHPTYKRVAGITSRILYANSKVELIRNRKWHVVVLDNPMVNAFVVANGFIFVFTGMANLANDDQLSIIIGHELAHCILRHINNFNSVMLVFHVLCMLPITALLSIALPFSWALLTISLSQFIFYVGVKLVRHRFHEIEADRVGLELAANACVDVTQGYRFWEIMAILNERPKHFWHVWWMQTHPTDISRAHYLFSLIPEAKELQKLAGC
ncbi:metalloendopeptidase OMA1, mitochondrial-like [Aphis gossypii]|nr:metalloendopeptidase OMA1, mitochondrial-like [Aphis gossypii]